MIRLHSLVVLALFAAWGWASAAESPVVDGHSHQGLSWKSGAIETSGLEDLAERGIEVVVHAMPVDRSRGADLEARIASETEGLRSAAEEDSGWYLVTEPGRSIDGAPREAIGVILAIEWFEPVFGSDVASVGRFRDLGIRMIGLVEDDPDGLFVERGTATLSPFGRRIIEAMNDAGIVIDITHLSHQQMIEVIRVSRNPVVASHSNTRAVTPSRWNLSDEVIAALAAREGSVWLTFNSGEVLGEHDDDTEAVERLVDHVDVLVKRLGPECVGIGSDLQAGGRYVPATLNTPETFASIRRSLEGRGYSARTIDGVLGGNVLRALADPR